MVVLIKYNSTQVQAGTEKNITCIQKVAATRFQKEQQIHIHVKFGQDADGSWMASTKASAYI
jgi:hypothetical protein